MSWNKAGKIFFVASFLAFAMAVLISRQPPILRDYPDWVYQGVLLAKTLTGHPVPGYALRAYPVPNTITTLGLGLLTVAFGWVVAAKLWVVLYLVSAAAVSLYAGSVFGALKMADSGGCFGDAVSGPLVLVWIDQLQYWTLPAAGVCVFSLPSAGEKIRHCRAAAGLLFLFI